MLLNMKDIADPFCIQYNLLNEAFRAEVLHDSSLKGEQTKSKVHPGYFLIKKRVLSQNY